MITLVLAMSFLKLPCKAQLGTIDSTGTLGDEMGTYADSLLGLFGKLGGFIKDGKDDECAFKEIIDEADACRKWFPPKDLAAKAFVASLRPPKVKKPKDDEDAEKDEGSDDENPTDEDSGSGSD